MSYREINAVRFTQNINALCGQNVELLSVKLVVHVVTAFTQSIGVDLLLPVITCPLSVYLCVTDCDCDW
jgi:hypothetical protein